MAGNSEEKHLLAEAEDIMKVDKTGVAVLQESRKRIVSIAQAYKEMAQVVTPIRNLVTTINEINVQTADFASRTHYAVQMFSREAQLAYNLHTKLSEYGIAISEITKTIKDLQKKRISKQNRASFEAYLKKKQQEANQAVMAFAELDASFQEIKNMVPQVINRLEDLRKRAGNVLGNINSMQLPAANNLKKNTQRLATAAATMAEQARDLPDLITSTSSKYGNVLGTLTKAIEDLKRASEHVPIQRQKIQKEAEAIVAVTAAALKERVA